MFCTDFAQNRKVIQERLRVADSFDLVTRSVRMGGKQAELYFVDGMVQDDTLNKILELLLQQKADELAAIPNARAFADAAVTYGETDVTRSVQDFLTHVLSGVVGMILEGFDEAILIDVRIYPVRPVTEPENDRVLRGPREGFVETLVTNTALVRRRLRDPMLTMERFQLGERSKCDVVLCYLADRADAKLVARMRRKLQDVHVEALTQGLESLTECLCPKQWWNPFPRSRYTERPDCATAAIAEGQIVLLMDNTPVGMILPTGIFDFLQDTNDFAFLPATGTYLRWLRLLISGLTTVLTPIWYYLMEHPQHIPPPLDFIRIHEPIDMPLFFQLVLIELVIGALKLASLNTPSSLSSSFSVIGALVLGEFAVSSQLMVPETVLYMAFVTIANFAQPSYELGYALTFSRMLLLLFCVLFGFWGLIAGGVLLIAVISCTQTVSGNCYWYPLIPFRPKALLSLFLRRPIVKIDH
ncbi:MAG: spore germination protein [Oscillospiraceae bacterium]|jgi:stage V sporulation protein AF|nr:spore germination protein [Oscillospiraceae bacterium]